MAKPAKQSVETRAVETLPGHPSIAQTPIPVAFDVTRSASLDRAVEKQLRRKTDRHVLPPVALLYLFCFIDRSNVGNARIAGLEKDLQLHGNDFNVVLSVFFVSYIVFDLPSTLACKAVGPAVWLLLLALEFGVCTIVMAFVTDFATISGVRFLMGVFEAGMLPGIAYYLSRWYRRDELASRLPTTIVTAPLAGASGGFLASGILSLESIGSVRSWRMIILVEGVITCGLAVAGFAVLTDRPELARWLSPAEKQLAEARLTMENTSRERVLDRLGGKKVWRGISNPIVLATALIFLLDNVTAVSIAIFLPTIIATIYPTAPVAQQQLYTVPPYLLGALAVIVVPYLSLRSSTRIPYFLLTSPLMILGYILFLASRDPHVRYGATFLVTMGAFPFGALCPAHASANVTSDTARSAAMAMVVTVGTLGALISTWSFLQADAPDFIAGNALNLGTSSGIFLVSAAMCWWMRRDNQQRDERARVGGTISSPHEEPCENMDWRDPAFRWRS